MASLGSSSSNQSTSGCAYWCEVNPPSAQSVANGTVATTHTVTMPTTGSGSVFNPNLPIGVVFLNQTAVQGSTNTGLNAAIGVQAVTISGSTVSIVFVNNSAGAVNTPSTGRLVLVQVQGN